MAKKAEQTPLKKGVSQFNIVGKVKLTDNTFAIDNESQTSDWIYSSMRLGIEVGSGVVFTNLMGGYGAKRENVLYVHGIKKDENGKTVADYDDRFTIDWEDREDEDILETVADDCFIKVGIEKDKKGNTYVEKFLSAYDAVAYLSEHLENGMVVNVSGALQYQYYNNNVTVQKNIKSIYLSNKEENEYKAEFRQTILLDNDSIEKFDKDKNTYPIDCYVVEYVGKIDDTEIKKNVVMPKTLYFDVLNEKEPEKTKAILNKFFKPSKKNNIVELGVIGSFTDGGVVSTATIDDIDEDVKYMLEMGMITEEEALAKYTNGQQERRMVIKSFITTNDSDDTEKKHIVIKKDDGKYTVDDLVFVSQFIDNEDDNDDDEIEDNNFSNNVSDDDTDEDWLRELMNE